MGAALYYIFVWPFIHLISVLPFWLLYGVSDVLFVLIYYVFGYRKKVVSLNLQNAFPGKSAKERKDIEWKFYRHLCDTIVETLKLLTISPWKLRKRVSFDTHMKELFGKFNSEKKSMVAVMGHCGNWEWAGCAFSLEFEQQLYAIYHPLSNKQFDKLLYNMRARFGNKLIAMKDVLREMIKNKNEVCVNTFIADQTPAPEGAYWTTFLNQQTPVFFGTEKIARKLNQPVVFVSVVKVKRGHYKVNAKLVSDNPKELQEGEISELHTRILEKDIIAQPYTWLWSHKRWKHTGKYAALKEKGLVN